MTLANISKPSSSLANVTKVSIGLTWADITTTWATETRTWLAISQLFTNTSKNRTLGSYTFDEIGNTTIDSHGGAMNDSSAMINIAKPA